MRLENKTISMIKCNRSYIYNTKPMLWYSEYKTFNFCLLPGLFLK